jgi:hypothetical protein
VAEAVVDALEVVDVDETHAERETPLVGLPQLPLETFVEVPMVAEPRKRVGQSQAHGAERPDDRALVELDREQRADERDREEGRPFPEDDEHQRRRGHQRERHDRQADVLPREADERAARADGHNGGDQDQVDGVLGRRGGSDTCEDPVASLQRRGDGAGRGRRQRQDRDVVRDPHRRTVLQQLGDARGQEDDEHSTGPAEEDDRRDAEDERKRHAALDALHGHREAIGERRGGEQRRDAQEGGRPVRRHRKRRGGSTGDPEAGNADRQENR